MNNSKYIILNVVTLIFLIVASHSVSYARKTSFEVDQKESKVGFMVKHKITKDVYGGFRNVEGIVTFDKKLNSIVNVEAKINVNSIDTGNFKRDRHLKSPDFFDVNNFPFIIFESSDVKKLENGKYIVRGLLTMRGVTKNITLRGERKKNTNNKKIKISNSKPNCLLIGPEGDYSADEIKKILNFKGSQSIKLSNNILRSETAVISALSVINYLQN